MPCLVPADLLTRFGAEEMAQLSDRRIPRLVTAERLAEAVRGEDMSGLPADEAAAIAGAIGWLRQSIEDAQSEVDSYLAARYAVPIAAPPPVLKRLTGDIARFVLYEDHAKEEVRKRYEDALKFLRDVAAGKASLGAGEETPTPPGPAGGSVEIVSAGKVFGRRERGL